MSNTIRGAVANWAKTWATEVAIHGITVNNVLPGATHTARLTSLAEAKAKAAGTTPEAVLAGMAAKVPAGRVGQRGNRTRHRLPLFTGCWVYLWHQFAGRRGSNAFPLT